MAKFVLYARISQSGNRYVAVVTAVPDSPEDGLGTFAATRANSKEAAEIELDRLVAETRESLTAAGHRVSVRTEEDLRKRDEKKVRK
jgi:hypothetical protein